MCGRYSISTPASKLAERFKIDVPEGYTQHYNASPTKILPVITNEHPQGLSFFYWGVVPAFAKNRSVSSKLFNVKAETILEKTSSLKALQARRCLVPADGFYDWKNLTKKRKIPYRFVVKQPEIFSFAGLWEEYEDEEEGMVHTFSIITTAPNRLTGEMNNIMPVILKQENEKKWLSNGLAEEEYIKMLTPFSADLMNSFTVSSLINNPELNKPELLKPAPPSDQFGNYTLFS